MKKSIILSSILLITILFGCKSKIKEEKTQVLFNSRIEAEKVAESLNCEGAHKMGDKWMPCKSHKDHEDNSHKNHNHH